MTRRSRLATPALVAAGALVLSACGSTVQMRSSTRSVTGGNGLTVDAGATAGATTDSTTAADSGLTVGGSNGTGRTSTVVTGRGAAGQPGTGSVGAMGPGITADSIYVGIVYAVNNDAVQKAGGANGISLGDERANANAVIDDINQHGGVAGRKLVPVFHPFDSTSTQTLDQQWQNACTDFTQDHKVMAAIDQGTEAWRQCMQDHGVVLLDDNLPTADHAEFLRHHHYIELGYPNLDRIAAFLAASLADQGYFNPWNNATGAPGTTKAKVGVLTFNTDAFKHATDAVLVPALTKLGYPPQVAYIAEIQTASDYSNEAAAVSSAQLKFRQSGVDHVIVFDSNGSLALFFMNTASSQHYYPRYGGHTGSAFQVLASTGDAPADQFRGAMGFGWDPGLDLPSDQNTDNGPYSNDARRQCLAVMKAHRITFSDPNAEGVALGTCSTMWLIRAALTPAPKVINDGVLIGNIERLGESFQAAGGLGEHFGPGRHDGKSKGYYWQFVPSCTCMHYIGPLRTIP